MCSRESERADSSVCPTKLLWTRVRFSIVSTLRETTLADLLCGHRRSPRATLPSLDMPLPADPAADARRLADPHIPTLTPTLTTGA